MEAELMYWLPPSRVKQSGKATTTGGMRCSPISRSSRSGRFSRKPVQFVCAKPLPVKPTRSTSRGNSRPSCPAGRYTSTTLADGSPSILVSRAWLSIVSRLTEPVGPKNLRIASYLQLLPILSAEITAGIRVRRKRGMRNRLLRPNPYTSASRSVFTGFQAALFDRHRGERHRSALPTARGVVPHPRRPAGR